MTEPHPPYTSAAIDALTEAVENEHDFAEWLSMVLAYAAARKGSLDALTAGRPGSWEAGHVDRLVRGRVFEDADLRWYAEDDRKRRDPAAEADAEAGAGRPPAASYEAWVAEGQEGGTDG